MNPSSLRRMIKIVAPCAGATVAILAFSNMRPAANHSLFHINCPPGSHGTAWQDSVGRKLYVARQSASALGLAPGGKAMTAGHPGFGAISKIPVAAPHD